MSSFETAASIAARQHGLITTRQLRSAGLTERRIRTLCGNGLLVRRSPGLYAVAGTAPTWTRALMGHVLSAGPLALASHRSAAGLWRLDRFRRQHADVVAPYPARRRPAGSTVHESSDLPARDRTVLEDVPVTTPARTIIDMGRYVSTGRLTAMLDDAVRRNLTTYREVQQRFGELAGRGRDGIATVRAVLDTRPDGSTTPDSPLEDEARRLLLQAGLPEPVLHHRVDCGELTYVLDLAWPGALVALECDGFRFHRTPDQLDWDDRRRTRLGLQGWLVLHATRRTLVDDPWGLVRDVKQALDR